MRKILTLIAVFAILTSYSQDCEVTAVGLSYNVPKGASIEVVKTGKFQAGVGLMFNYLTSPILKDGREVKSTLELFSYGGYRIYHREYKTAIYVNGGYFFGDVKGLRLYLASKAMLLREQWAYAIEPYYNGDLGLKLTIYKKL